MLALSGRVPVKIDPDSEPIEVGDFLTSSSKPGYAIKATKAGYTVGKALENWNASTGSAPSAIDVFVNIGYFMGPMTADGYFDTGLKIKVADIKIDPDPIATDSASLSLREQIASISAQLAVLSTQYSVLSTPEHFSLSSENWSYATESGKLISILPVQVPELTVTGKLQVGLLTFDDMEASLSSLTGEITIKGDLAITGKIRILGDSIGQAIMASGSASLTIETAAISSQSAVFVTPNIILDSPLSVTQSSPGASFKVEIPHSLDRDLPFKWWVVN